MEARFQFGFLSKYRFQNRRGLRISSAGKTTHMSFFLRNAQRFAFMQNLCYGRWTFMGALSLGQIGKLSGYARTRIHQLAVDGQIPFKPIKQPPVGQYRYADTPEIRAWCDFKRTTKPKVASRRPRPPRRGKIGAQLGKFIEALDSGTLERNDLVTAINLLNACKPLFEPPSSFNENPCTRGVLAYLCFLLVRSPARRVADTIPNANGYDGVMTDLLAAYSKLQTEPPSHRSPA
jgi:hypothetical protein